MSLYNCSLCEYETKCKSNYERHKLTKKHLKKTGEIDKFTPKREKNKLRYDPKIIKEQFDEFRYETERLQEIVKELKMKEAIEHNKKIEK